jgi:hypothetical protein
LPSSAFGTTRWNPRPTQLLEKRRRRRSRTRAYKKIAADLVEWIRIGGNALRLWAGFRTGESPYEVSIPFIARPRAVELLLEIVVQYVQTLESSRRDLGGLSNRAGVTMIVTIEGRIRYIIRKPASEHREKRTRDWSHTSTTRVVPAGLSRALPRTAWMAAFAARAMDSRRWR